MFTMDAILQLQQAGHQVTPADGVPGLWNVAGLASDVTTNQIAQLAMQHGREWLPVTHKPCVMMSPGA